MARGRNTAVVAVRMSDKSIEVLRERASQKGVGYTVLARNLVLKGLGLKEELPEDNKAEPKEAIQAINSLVGREKGRLKRKAKGKKKHSRH